MPVVALDKVTQERVCLTAETAFKIRTAYSDVPRRFVCQLCGAPMYIRSGITTEIRPHFVHFGERSNSNVCTSKLYRPESREHLAGKDLVYDWVSEHISVLGLKGFSVEYEYRAAGRIADVMLVYPNGDMHAFEVQLSAISIEKIQERTESYEREGINVTWILGPKVSQAKQVGHWLREAFGEVWTIRFEEPSPSYDVIDKVYAEGLFGAREVADPGGSDLLDAADDAGDRPGTSEGTIDPGAALAEVGREGFEEH